MISARILGADAIAERLAGLPDTVQQGLARAVARISVDLVAAAQEKVSGDVLQSRSGALRASIVAEMTETEGAVGVTVGSDLPYSGFQEYGFTGVETVSAHLRTIKQAFGRPLRGGEKQIAVRDYTRKIDYPAHSFLRAALADMQPEIADALDAAVAEAVTPRTASSSTRPCSPRYPPPRASRRRAGGSGIGATSARRSSRRCSRCRRPRACDAIRDCRRAGR